MVERKDNPLLRRCKRRRYYIGKARRKNCGGWYGVSGNSYVDESMLSGEPVPVLKNENEKVFAGTINQKGSFQFKAVK
jgi:hypothetical protein